MGDWVGIRTDAKDGRSFPIKITVRPILGGDGFTEEIEVQTGSKPYFGFSASAFCAIEGVWIMNYVNRSTGKFVKMQGDFADGSAVWNSIDAERLRESRLCYERSDGAWTRTQMASEDGGATWFTIFTDELQTEGGPD